jgi:hypothetical protein
VIGVTTRRERYYSSALHYYSLYRRPLNSLKRRFELRSDPSKGIEESVFGDFGAWTIWR